MEVTFWGTRGSIAKAGPTTLRYGGNTSCVSIRSDAGTQLVIDCGTGAHGLGQALQAVAGGGPVNGHILISHTHWDHIQGLPFFAPLFVVGNHWHIYGPSGLGGSLGEILAGQMEYRYFPVDVAQLAARVEHHDLVEGALEIDDVRVETRYLNHPALTLGYRIEADGAVVVYSSDHEPHDQELAGGGDVARNRHDGAHATFVAGADLLIHDAQYCASEYADHVGWGHSTVEYVIDVARRAEVAQVALYHHDPTRTDEQVDELVELARRRAAEVGYGGRVIAAAEQMTIALRGDGDRRWAADGPADRRRSAPATASALAVRASTAVVFARSPAVREHLVAACAEDLEVVAREDLREVFDIVRSGDPAIVVIEAVEDDGGFDLVAAIRALDGAVADVPIIMVGRSEDRWRPDAGETGITEWLVWPFSAHYLRTKLRAWVLRRASRWEDAPLPRDEDRRVQALRDLGLLDTAPETRFDRYTSKIATTLDVPIALVTLVDSDRQWFKSRQGLDIEETPREMSICAHAILGHDVMEIPDALDDARFAENPIVAGEPRLRFYAGMPLALADGSRVGTLCVADYRPRRLDESERAELRRVAALVSRELVSPAEGGRT
jgi:phosphoribosyl 1,2-cyclic phosphodiesterase/DNA-binding response OmpR family regulator